MTTHVAVAKMTEEEMVALVKKHTLFEWSAQSKVDPLPVAKAKGIYFWTPEGKRFIEWNECAIERRASKDSTRSCGGTLSSPTRRSVSSRRSFGRVSQSLIAV